MSHHVTAELCECPVMLPNPCLLPVLSAPRLASCYQKPDIPNPEFISTASRLDCEVSAESRDADEALHVCVCRMIRLVFKCITY